MAGQDNIHSAVPNPIIDPVKVTVVSGSLTATTDSGTAITGEALEAGGVGALGWLSSLRKKLDQLKTTIILAAGENHIGEIAGRVRFVNATFARPADTTAYTAKDVVSNNATTTTMLQFSNAARVNGGGGYILKAQLMTDQSTCTARFRLWLYQLPSASLPTAVPADNATFPLKWANRAKRIGYIDFVALSTEGTGSDAASALSTDVRLAFGCDAADSAIYGLLEALDAFTPASGQNFYVDLGVEQY